MKTEQRYKLKYYGSKKLINNILTSTTVFQELAQFTNIFFLMISLE